MIKGIESFCPINKVHRQWSDRIKLIEEPLFAGQVFVKICDDERVHVRMTAGVRNIVYFDGKPSVLKEKEINSIRKFSETYSNIKLLKHSLDQQNGISADSIDSIFDIKGSLEYLKMPSLKVESLGFILFADSKYAIVQR